MVSQKTLGIVIGFFAIVLIVILSFVKADLDRKSAFLCRAVEESPELSMEDCPAHEGGASWLLFGAFGLVSLILGFGIYVFVTAKESRPRPAVRLSKLGEDELVIVKALQKEGSSYQSDLIRETGWSKVRMTRVLDRLESKGVVERKRRGMTNIVVLKP